MNYCFATDPFLMGIATVFGGVPALYLARSLRNVYDPFGIRQELELVLWTAIFCGGNTLLLDRFFCWSLAKNFEGMGDNPWKSCA